MFSNLLKVVFILSVYSLAVFGSGTPKLRDYAESGPGESSGITLRDGDIKAPPTKGQVSTVSIQVGETKNNFYYTVNGETYSPFKISVYGEYYNNEILGTGYTNLFLSAEPHIYYYWIEPQPNGILDVIIDNGNSYESYDARFFYEIIAPYPVSSSDLVVSQVNITTLRFYGPSRSFYYP